MTSTHLAFAVIAALAVAAPAGAQSSAPPAGAKPTTTTALPASANAETRRAAAAIDPVSGGPDHSRTAHGVKTTHRRAKRPHDS